MAVARESIAASLGSKTDPEQFILTSSGSEANQLAVRSIILDQLKKGRKAHWITTPVEHDSNLKLIEWVSAQGGMVSLLPVDSDGRPQSQALEAMLRPETALVSVVWVNNETGVISDLAPISALLRDRGIRLHVDAAQAWGKLPLDAETLGADLIALSGHKIGGLAGTGALWVGRGVPIEASIPGKQEKGRRGGTENLLGAISMGAAAAAIDPLAYAQELAPLRERLESLIVSRIDGTRVNGWGAPRVANTTNLSFDGVEGESLVMALDLAGFSVSSGSACSSGVLEPSHVLLAMGRSKAQAMAAVRVSLSRGESWENLEGFVMALEKIVNRVRNAKRE